ncbi:MAG: transglutaminase family protein [Acetobacteraceae bacterium]|nr:transglutaminase family protein [Acetobacteraceae bacterium]MBV8524202.1 transglutaminase family protein [Acetobacteraceae bacterium]MBV8588823.1 transglutaminase family protein [Acetobacteraceae bacterium]
MLIRAGFRIGYDLPRPTPMILVLSVHPSRLPGLRTPHEIAFDPAISAREYRDGFGNICHRIVGPEGRLTISNDFIIEDSGAPDEFAPDAQQHPIEDLPDDVLVYLLGSRYCETDRLSDTAWSLFADSPLGWGRVQAICDYVHERITFGYEYARPTKTAWDAFMERKGVCRDFTHLAVTFCRCMNIPARYCTGYLGDIGVPPADSPMDFSAWFEAYLGGRWYTFDARHNHRRIGRILMAHGRDATDVAITTNFGSATLAEFAVITDEILEGAAQA